MDLRATHDELATALAAPTAELARRAARESFRRGLHLGIAAMPRIATVLALGFFGGSYIVERPLFQPWALPAMLALVPLAGGLAMRSAARRTPPDGYDAALVLDERNGNQDRLSAALELADDPQTATDDRRAALARAAVEDGRESLRRIDLRRVDVDRPPLRWRYATALFALLIAITPAVLLTFPSGPAREPSAGAGEQRPTAVARNEGEAARTPSRDALAERRDEGAPKPPDAAKPAAPANRTPRERNEPSPAEQKSSNAGAGSGAQPAAAEDAARASESAAARAAAKGAASNSGSGASGKGAAASESGSDEMPKEAQKPAAKKAAEQRAAETEKSDKEPSSGSPSGASRGGGRLAAVGNERSGADRGVEREDDLDSEDEEVEDEKEETEQRGGVVPTKRDRRQAASRELTISGNGPPSDGRGGPTPPKKSRGTASLVLGIRMPDQVRGRPNPGTAKTSIEPVPPTPADAPARPASPAIADRASPHVQATQPSIGDRAEFLRRYHELVRTRAPKTPVSSATPRNE